MELVRVNKDNRKDFLDFYKRQYLNNSLKRDCLSGVVKNILYGRSEICKSVDTLPLMIIDENEITMICLLAHAERMPRYVQICFFESDKDNMEAFNLILARAVAMAKEKKADKITASLNIHVNYGLGFLASHFDQKQSFGSAHNPDFYNDYFERAGFSSIDMVTFKKNMVKTPDLMTGDMRARLKEIYRVRKADFKNFKEDMDIYTRINNEAFRDHLFYYERKTEEDYELFKELKYLMKEENLLFVEKKGIPVGFMLWYPDFNEIIKEGQGPDIRTLIKSKLFPRTIKTFKIVEMGVVPRERNRGAILALFDYCFEATKGKYDMMESSWVLASNLKSKSFGIKWADAESKHYKAYIKEII